MEKQNRSAEEAPTATAGVPNPEVSATPKRRTFTAKYKLDILEEVEACQQPGEVGAILRREGLYSSHLTEWRKERERGALEALGKKRGRKPARNPLVGELEALRRENAHLKRRLEQAETIIDIQKKISSLLGLRMPQLAESGS